MASSSATLTSADAAAAADDISPPDSEFELSASDSEDSADGDFVVDKAVPLWYKLYLVCVSACYAWLSVESVVMAKQLSAEDRRPAWTIVLWFALVQFLNTWVQAADAFGMFESCVGEEGDATVGRYRALVHEMAQMIVVPLMLYIPFHFARIFDIDLAFFHLKTKLIWMVAIVLIVAGALNLYRERERLLPGSTSLRSLRRDGNVKLMTTDVDGDEVDLDDDDDEDEDIVDEDVLLISSITNTVQAYFMPFSIVSECFVSVVTLLVGLLLTSEFLVPHMLLAALWHVSSVLAFNSEFIDTGRIALIVACMSVQAHGNMLRSQPVFV
eukprot:TRINITY_DN112898_c0_g1_i1.p1 TRINITY_DN112898_c0_g1~~TRINITY_DN112898_c0_g1_i1.p1  ORF type:complete len:327 (-),score=140.59 TRINITY_DN112898_c0_g1_i1:26-1006(-)